MFGIRRAGTIPGDLLAFTTTRLLWITDRDGGGRADYGSIVRYTRFSNVRAIARSQDGCEPVLEVTLGPCDVQWRIPVNPAAERAAQFFEP
jgi:hypothetical protein